MRDNRGGFSLHQIKEVSTQRRLGPNYCLESNVDADDGGGPVCVVMLWTIADDRCMLAGLVRDDLAPNAAATSTEIMIGTGVGHAAVAEIVPFE